jgi:predicted nucleic acid-binding protein
MNAHARYWDSDTFLGWLQEEEGKVEDCRNVLRACESGNVTLVTSSLTIAEVLALRGKPKITKAKSETVRDFFRRSYIVVRDLDRVTAEFARELVWDYSITPKDAIHVATAIKMHGLIPGGIVQFDTFDRKLIAAAGKLTIKRPNFGVPNLPAELF